MFPLCVHQQTVSGVNGQHGADAPVPVTVDDVYEPGSATVQPHTEAATVLVQQTKKRYVTNSDVRLVVTNTLPEVNTTNQPRDQQQLEAQQKTTANVDLMATGDVGDVSGHVIAPAVEEPKHVAGHVTTPNHKMVEEIVTVASRRVGSVVQEDVQWFEWMEIGEIGESGERVPNPVVLEELTHGFVDVTTPNQPTEDLNAEELKQSRRNLVTKGVVQPGQLLPHHHAQEDAHVPVLPLAPVPHDVLAPVPRVLNVLNVWTVIGVIGVNTPSVLDHVVVVVR